MVHIAIARKNLGECITGLNQLAFVIALIYGIECCKYACCILIRLGT